MSTPDASGVGARRGTAHPAADPSGSLWLGILKKCVLVTTSAIAVTAAVAAFVTGPGAALSALFGFAVVVAFFGISLAVGHFAGRNNPSGAIGLFAVTYAIKVVGFAVVLFVFGTPPWLEANWFFGGAVGTVILWQTVELYVFSKARHQLYNDPAPTAPVPGNEFDRG
ncbi:hypothetical protein ACX80T_11675 [Arthrobacter sp. Sr33]|uniref:hypothetical protein n=1 Tax=Arthrobacter sp. TB 23 TaxID=494419 RepID=UPI0002F9F822|nr:hypothetical protein [Arthrobacter sp. TB 23]